MNLKVLILIFVSVFIFSGCSTNLFQPSFEEKVFEANSIKVLDSTGAKLHWYSLDNNALTLEIDRTHPRYKKIKEDYFNFIRSALQNKYFRSKASSDVHNQVRLRNYCKKIYSMNGLKDNYNNCVNEKNFQYKLSLASSSANYNIKKYKVNNVEYIYTEEDIPYLMKPCMSCSQNRRKIDSNKYVIAFIEPDNTNSAYMFIGTSPAENASAWGVKNVHNKIDRLSRSFVDTFLSTYRTHIPVKLISSEYLREAWIDKDGLYNSTNPHFIFYSNESNVPNSAQKDFSKVKL